MLNYTSKIQHFLNLHRKHTKYIVVLLLLSAFVASFVCSALTEPAVSMTDPIQMGQNVTLLADGDQSDGLPKLTYNYSASESQFKEYIYWNADWESNIRPDHLFGSAHNFGMFAFDTINVGSSCNSNLAAPNLKLGHTFGLGSIADNGGQEITVATNSVELNSSLTSRNTVLLFPENVKFIDEQGKPVNINPLPRVQIGGNHLEKGNSAVYAYHVTSNFINFGEEQGKFKQLQQKLIHKTSDTVAFTTYDQTDRIEKVTVSTEGINYLTIPYTQLPDGSRAINFEIENNAALIINVDLKDAPLDYKTGFQVNGKVNGLDFQKDDKASINGVNILWNFYDSSQTEKQYSGSITFDNPGYGCILAPSATVTLSATYAGNIVANNINAGATVNKAMFMTGVKATSSFIALMAAKEWNDGNENHSSDYVTFQLYKSSVANANINDLTETVGDPVEVRSTDNWNYTWFNLDQSYYYYVKEVEAGSSSGTYLCDTEYTNNGGNKTGTITVKNKKVDSSSIDTSAKLNLTVKMYWSDNAEAHEYCKGNNNGCKYDADHGCSNNSEYHKNKTVALYRSTSPNLDISKLNDSEKEALKLSEERDGLYNGSTLVYSNEEWQLTINNLPVYDTTSGQLYYYYAQIPYGSEIYSFNYSNNGISRNSGTITVGCIKKLKLTVNKVWKGESKDSATFEVYRSMTQQKTIPSDAVKVNNEYRITHNNNTWQTIVSDLPQSDIYANKYYYYIKETKVNDNESELSKYNVSYAYNDELYSYPFNDHGEMTITNERKQAGNVSIKVTKRMTVLNGTSKAKLQYSNDGYNWYDYYVDGKQIIQTLSEANNWQCTFINLPKAVTVDNQTKQRSYRVLEEDTPPGFNVSYSGNVVLAYDSADNTIHNVYINNNEKLVTINVKKIWNNISPDLIKHVIVKVYRYKGDITQISNLSIENGIDINSYINMLNDSLTPKLNDKTATYSDVHYKNNNNYSSQNYNAWVNLSQFSGKTINEIKIKFSSGCGSDQNFLNNTTHFACDKFDKLKNISQSNQSPFYRTGNSVQNSYSSNWSTTSTTIVFNELNVQLSDNYHFVIATANDYTTDNTKYIEEIIFTFNEAVGEITPSEPGQGDEDDTESDDEPTIETSGNIVTYRNWSFVKKSYSDHNWNIHIDLSEYSSRKLISATAILTGTNIEQYSMLIFGTLGNEGKIPQGGNTKVEQFNSGSSVTLNVNSVVGSNCIVITAGDYDDENTPPPFSLESLVLTFEENTGNSGISFPTGYWQDNNTYIFNNQQGCNDSNGQYSDDYSKYNYVYKLPSDAYGKQITKIEYTFSDSNFVQNGRYRIICGTQDKLKDPLNAVLVKIIDGSIPSNQGLSYNNGTVTYVVSGDTYYNQNGNNDRLGALSSSGDSYLVFATSDTNYAPTFQITNLKITFASTAIHNGKNHSFQTGYIVNAVTIDDNRFHNKEVDKIQMYFNKNISQFPDWSVYDIWLGSYYNEVGYREAAGVESNIATWDFMYEPNYPDDGTKKANKIKIRPVSSEIVIRAVNNTKRDVNKVVITYTDKSTYTITNTQEYQSSDQVTYDYYFENGNQLTMTQSSYYTLYIPENFKDKAVKSIEAHFANLQTFDLSNFDNEILNMWINGKDGYEFWKNNHEKKNATNNVLTKDYSSADDDNRKNLQQITISPKKNVQNLEKIVVTFDSGTITIYNKSYDQNNLATGSGNQGGETGIIKAEFWQDLTNDSYLSITPNSNYPNIPTTFSTKVVKSIECVFYNIEQFYDKETNYFDDEIFNMYVLGNNSATLTEEKTTIENKQIKTYSGDNRINISEIVIDPKQHTQNLKEVIVSFEDGSTIIIYNNKFDQNNLATGSGNTETLEHSETINVLSTNLNADGNLDYSKSLAWRIPDQFRGFTVKEIKAEFHNRNKLTREGTEYYNTVFNMNIYAINDKQLYENWDIGDYKSEFDDEKHLIYKRYLPKNYNNEEKYSYSELDFLLICTAYTENLKQIVITFEGDHTITLINGNAGTNIEEPLEYNPYDITLVETITLTAGNNWEHILSNQPMVAPDGSPYYYVIEEIEIEYKDGTKLSSAISISNLFEVESTVLNALDLEENPNNNNLTVTNKLKTTNTTMPSTGGIGTHPYRNAGILMMICSGGIYISLRALRKKQN